jgi:DNA-binding transcriptional regulator LsrR (DeoR family)
VGDVLGNYLDVDGALIAAPHNERVICLSIEALRRIGTVIAVAREPEKTLAILGALRGGIIDVLIVDEGNARALLEIAGPPSPGEAGTGLEDSVAQPPSMASLTGGA